MQEALTLNGQEKRSAVRVAYVSEVQCEGAGIRLTARTADISTSGVFVHSKICCEAGTILTLRFTVGSTQIEANGEVCYSLPLIGMGVRFLDLKADYRAAIEQMVEGLSETGCEEIGTHLHNLIPSGVEPVDKLLGGLHPGHLYLTHGDASGKSLFGIQFIIEGLKRGQKAALIIPYSPEDAIRRFVRLGYDCLRDIDSNRLVIFKYPEDIGEQILELRELAPVLRDLESMLAETGPERLVFDPVTRLLTGRKEELADRATEFAVWVRSFGATVLLIATGDHGDAVENLMPMVKESFRFEVKEDRDRFIRQIVFETSPTIPDQSIRVDPSRGISLVESQRPNGYEESGTTPAMVLGLDEDVSRVEEEGSISGAHNPNPEQTARPATAFSEMMNELRSFISDLDPDPGAAENDPLDGCSTTAICR